MRGTIEERFWAKVEKTDGCWEWKGARHAKGYGRMGLTTHTTGSTHRVSFEIANGPIPEGMQVDHVCHNKPCVRPSHLRLVTPKKNMENRAGANKNSKSGVRGVAWMPSKNRWRAEVTHNWKATYVGIFKTIEEAETAVIAKRLELFTHNDLDRAA